MSDPWQPGAPPPEQQPAPYGYAPPGYGYQGDGPPGKVRSTGTVLLLAIVTLGIYTYVYNYQVHDEMKRHSGRGIGGGIALLLSFLAGIAMPFVTPAEVGSLYTRKNQRPPVNGWTGLWVIVPSVVGYVFFFVALVATASTVSESSTGLAAGLVAGAFLWITGVLAGGIVWLVKTNGALNRYWQTLTP